MNFSTSESMENDSFHWRHHAKQPVTTHKIACHIEEVFYWWEPIFPLLIHTFFCVSTNNNETPHNSMDVSVHTKCILFPTNMCTMGQHCYFSKKKKKLKRQNFPNAAGYRFVRFSYSDRTVNIITEVYF